MKLTKAELTKNKLLESSKKLFAEKGYRATSIREIAEDAGINSSMISYYFNGKQGLLLELVMTLMNSQLPELAALISGSARNIEELKLRLEIFLDSTIKVGLKHWEVVKVLMTETYELSKFKEFNQGSLSMRDTLTQYLNEAKKSQIIRENCDVSIVADSLYALLMDQIINWKLNNQLLNYDISEPDVRMNWIRSILDIYFNGLEKTNSIKTSIYTLKE